MRRRALLARTALLTTPLVGLAGCSGFGDDGSGTAATDDPGTPKSTDTATAAPSSTPAAVRAEGDLAVIDHGLDRRNAGSDSELVAVDATVENGGSTAVDVLAVVRFLDDDGSVVEETEAETVDLAAGGTWGVELLFGGSGDAARAVTDYRLTVERA